MIIIKLNMVHIRLLLYIECYPRGQLRLFNGSTPNEVRVKSCNQYYFWSLICLDNINIAKVVCRQLGYSGKLADMNGMHVMVYFHTDTVNLKDDAYIGEQNEHWIKWPQIWQCSGIEASLHQCTWINNRNYCSHVGVICQHIGMRTKYYATKLMFFRL